MSMVTSDGGQPVTQRGALDRHQNLVLRLQDIAEREWIADFTYIRTAEGWLYVAAVVDLFSRHIVGWAIKTEMTVQLVTEDVLFKSKISQLLFYVHSQASN